jgi:glucose/arabinose dehydrogenase
MVCAIAGYRQRIDNVPFELSLTLPDMPRTRSRIILALLALAIAAAAAAYVTPKLLRRFYHHGLTIVTVAENLEIPWAMEFLPDGRMLVTERPGRMRIVGQDGRVGEPLAGVPPVYHSGEGGLLDVALDPGFAENRVIYWSYSEPAAEGRPGASTAVARGRIEEPRITDVQVIFRQPMKLDDGLHFGSRLLFAPDGRLFITLGDRSQRADSQKLDSAHGKILRIEADGRAPPDNPFNATPGALRAIWSYGHRNVQAIALHPDTGELWAAEHGPNGGDELNVIQPGKNYGWPVITYGCEYRTCAKIGEGTAKQGMEQPLVWWPTSTPPSSLLFLTSDRYPAWKGHALIGALWGPAMIRVQLDGRRAVDQDKIYLGKHQRVRDIKLGPDGWMYVLVNQPDGRILRLER